MTNVLVRTYCELVSRLEELKARRGKPAFRPALFPYDEAHRRSAAWDALSTEEQESLVEYWISERISHPWVIRILSAFQDELARRVAEAAEVAHQAHLATVRARVEAGSYPTPGPQAYGVSAEGAERWCCEWMLHLGAADAEVTRYTADGGVDIESTHWVAQVKHYAGAVDVVDVRALAGSATAVSKRGIFFTSGNYTASGLGFADQAGLALFSYVVERDEMVAQSNVASWVLENGLGTSPFNQ